MNWDDVKLTEAQQETAWATARDWVEAQCPKNVSRPAKREATLTIARFLEHVARSLILAGDEARNRKVCPKHGDTLEDKLPDAPLFFCDACQKWHGYCPSCSDFQIA